MPASAEAPAEASGEAAPAEAPAPPSLRRKVSFTPSTKMAPGDFSNSTPPRVLRPLISAYNSTPNLYLPGTKFDVSFTLTSTLVLILIRIVFFQLLLALGWPARSKMTTDSAASLSSIVHSTALLIGLWSCLTTHPKYVPSAKLTDAPQWWQDGATALLELCTGYMIFDFVLLIRDTRSLGLELSQFDIMVLGHHLATSFYMTSVRAVGAGQLSAMILMFAGELSNPLMNGLFVTRFAILLDCCNGPFVRNLHTALEPIFAFCYVYLRIILGPLAAAHLTIDLLCTQQGRRNVPIWMSSIWVGMTWSVIFGSGPFIEDALGMLRDGLVLKYDADYDYGERYMIQDEL